MKHVYLVKSPIWIEAIEHQYDEGEQDSYFLHQRMGYKERALAKEIEHAIEESEPELAPYIDEDSILKGVVTSMIVGIKDQMAVTRVEATRELTEEEMEELKEEITSQYSDGWGEGFDNEVDQYDVDVTMWEEEEDEDGNCEMVEETYSSTAYVYARFWNNKQFSIIVEKEGEETIPDFSIPKSKPRLKLIGEDGNIFFIVGRARRVLRDAGMQDKIEELTEKVNSSKNYDHALCVVMDYFEVY